MYDFIELFSLIIRLYDRYKYQISGGIFHTKANRFVKCIICW